jgi:hypothetical protein
MRRSQHYRPLLHIAWRQPGFARPQARGLRVYSGMQAGEPPPPDPRGVATLRYAGVPGLTAPPSVALQGVIRVYRERYLHLDADLLYSGSRDDYRMAPTGAAAQDSASAPASLAGEVLYSPLFRLTESRRMRSGELHYLDHPAFGILATITPYEPPSTNPAVPKEPTRLPEATDGDAPQGD